jgi:hypothetical protein
MLDFLQDVIFESEWDEWDDCNLSREDMKHFTTPPTESWNDFPSHFNPAVFEQCSLIQRIEKDGRDAPVTSKEVTIRALLEKSFLPHQKGKQINQPFNL